MRAAKMDIARCYVEEPMINDVDTAHALGALSARMIALEGAVAALASQCNLDRDQVLAAYKDFAESVLDRYVGLPVDDRFLELLQQSLTDVRASMA